jgi:PAS domain S-box-containing protein
MAFIPSIDGLPEAVIAVTQQERILFWNRAAEAIFGIGRTDAVGQHVMEIIVPPDRVADAKERLQRALRTGELSFEYQCRRADGSPVYADIFVQAIDDPATPHVMMCVRDVTQQKYRGQAAVLESRFRGLLDSAPDAMVISNADDCVLLVNAHAERLFGYARAEVVGQPVEWLVPSASRGRRKDGTDFAIEISRTPVETDEGVLISSAIRDITRQKSLEDQLREQYYRVQEANRLKSEFLANMSHELRTPLHAIIGFAELMHNGKAGPVSSDHKEYLGDILTSSRHLLQLINDVLDLAKIESGKVEFHPEPVDIDRVVAEITDVTRAMATAKHMQIETAIDADARQFTTDVGKFKQVLYNYVSNAIKFTPDGGRVTIRARGHGSDAIRFEVEDTGIGVSPEDAARLFVEFQQLDAGAGKKFQGTGLGLALTKRIVEAQGGHVGVEPAPGGGALFYAILPRQGKVATPPSAERLPGELVPRILIVQRESRERDWLGRALERAGYTIEVADSPQAALAACSSRSYDAITIEALFPDTLGRDLLAGIRAGGPNRETPVMMVAVSVEQNAGTALAVQDVVEKPSEPEDLLDLLRRTPLPVGGSGPILVVDDDPMALKLAETVLTKEGFAVRCSSNPVEALAVALTAPPSLVVLDLLMARMDGFEFLDRLRRNPSGRRVPVIVWTEKTITGPDRAALTAAAQAVVLKTHGTSALLDEVQALVPVVSHGR